MKSCDVVNQLRRVLGSISIRYGSCLTPSTASNTGNVLTLAFEAKHKLKTGQGAVLEGLGTSTVLKAFEITADGKLTGETATQHDLTADDPSIPTVTLKDTGIPALDGIEIVLERVPNRYTFVCDVSDLGLAAQFVEDTGLLVETYSSVFNGHFPLVVVDANTITVDVSNPDAPIPLDDSVSLTSASCLQYKLRITACATEERFFEAYTAQDNPEDVWLAVVMGDQSISRDRAVLSDGNQVKSRTDTRWLREFQEFNIYAVVPATESMLGSDGVDLALNEVKTDLYKALVGWEPDSEYTCPQRWAVTPVSNGVSAYNGAYYAHRFTFEVAAEITYRDQYQPRGDRAFRDIDFSLDGFFEGAQDD